MAQNNDGPGKRLKREEAKNTLYVTNPNDPRLKAYRDSLGLYNHANDYRNILLKNSISPIKTEIIIKNPDILDGINQNIPYSKIMNDKIKPIAYYDIGVGNDKQYNESAIYKKPERPVVLVNRKKSEPIKPLLSRQPTFATPEVISPVMRPVSVPEPTNMEEPMEAVIEEKPLVRKLPKAVMPRRAGGWGNQPLLMQLFPKLYQR